MGILDVLRGRAGPPQNGNGDHAKATANPGPVALAVPGVAHEGKGISFVDNRNLASIEPDIQFYSPDHTRTIVQIIGGGNSEAERVNGATAYATAVYAFAAMNYRATAVSEAPMMVVEEDAKGSEKWLKNHALEKSGVLDEPSLDYDMGELLARTQMHLDIFGRALWLKEIDGMGSIGGLSPFAGNEIKQIRATSRRVRGDFKLATPRGEEWFPAERVVYFHEIDPFDFHGGISRLDVVMGWLNLGQAARAAVQDILRNSLFPSIILQADPKWEPSPEEWELYKAELAAFARRDKRGGPLAVTGGGNATRVAMTLKELIPSDILNRVESVTSSVFGIPAIVLQYEVGLQNSPWSQMEQARRMCYQDTIARLWRRFEKQCTRQLLRAPVRAGGQPLDDNRLHYIRFDRSDIIALQPDREQNARVAQLWGKQASLNERREVLGLEPSDDPAADEVPELSEPSFTDLFGPGVAPDEDEEEETDAPARGRRRQNSEENEDGKSRRRVRRQTKATTADIRAEVFQQIVRAAEFDWELAVSHLLEDDRRAVVSLAESVLAGSKAETPSDADARRFRDEVRATLKERGQVWAPVLRPVMRANAQRAATMMADELGVPMRAIAPKLEKFIKREASWLIKGIAETTREAVNRALTDGMGAGESVMQIARRISTLPEFDRDRAKLVARTETTRVMNGAPTEALAEVGKETGMKFVKTWLTAGDDRVRDEHVELEGEQRPIDEPFSNGLQYPSEPNCRCVITNSAVEAF